MGNLTYTTYPLRPRPTTYPLLLTQKMAVGMVTLHWLGFLSNIIILLVFFKAGLSSSTNICFFYLAIADLAICVLNLFTDLCEITDSYSNSRSRICISVQFGHWPVTGRIVEETIISLTAWITAVICWERLLCIVLPMKVRFFLSQNVFSKL